MIPTIEWIRLPMKDSWTVLMIGMPPATAASKWIGVSCSFDSANSSTPRSASSALLPVTTGLPAFSAAATISKASVVPPISSTTMSTAGSSTSSRHEVVRVSSGKVTGRSFEGSRTSTLAISSFTWPPVRAEIRPALRSRASTTPEPTVPRPARPMPRDEQFTRRTVGPGRVSGKPKAGQTSGVFSAAIQSPMGSPGRPFSTRDR